MDLPSVNQGPLLLVIVGLGGSLLGWFGKGLAFLLKRRLMGSPKQERVAYLNTVVDIGAKLRAHGMTMEDVGVLEEIVQNPLIKASSAATQVVTEMTTNVPDNQAIHSIYSMKVRASAAYAVAETKLNQALTDLKLLIGVREWECMSTAQEHWKAYRTALEDCARREYEGGTHAGLAGGLTGLAETERRTAEIQGQVAERAQR